MTQTNILHRLMAAEERVDPGRVARVKETARRIRPGYPEIEAFSMGDLFSPQKVIRQARTVLGQLQLPPLRERVEELIIFMDLIDAKLSAEQGYNAWTWPPPCACN